MTGATVVVAERSRPGHGGHIHIGLKLKDRQWTCSACGSDHDRDHNAAKNLRLVAGSSLAAANLLEQSGSSVTVCGETSSGGGHAPAVKLVLMKQELEPVLNGHA